MSFSRQFALSLAAVAGLGALLAALRFRAWLKRRRWTAAKLRLRELENSIEPSRQDVIDAKDVTHGAWLNLRDADAMVAKVKRDGQTMTPAEVEAMLKDGGI